MTPIVWTLELCKKGIFVCLLQHKLQGNVNYNACTCSFIVLDKALFFLTKQCWYFSNLSTDHIVGIHFKCLGVFLDKSENYLSGYQRID